jgi:hypothetical protein
MTKLKSFEVPEAVARKNKVFWVGTSCVLFEIYYLSERRVASTVRVELSSRFPQNAGNSIAKRASLHPATQHPSNLGTLLRALVLHSKL